MRMICAAQNSAGNGSWPVSGTILILSDELPIHYCRVSGGADGYASLVQYWSMLMTSDYIKYDFTTTSEGYIADARTAYRLANRVQQTDWKSSHSITLNSGYFHLFVGFDCMYSVYCYSDGSPSVNQIYKSSSSKVTYTTGTNTIKLTTSDGGSCAFLIIRACI